MRAKLAKCERAALGQPSSSCDSTRAPSRIARSPDLTRRQSITTACAVNAQPQPGIRICRASSRRSVLMPCRRRDRRWSPPRRQGLGKSREGVACQIGRHLDLKGRVPRERRTRRWREMDSNLYGAFPVKPSFLVVVGSLFGAGKPFFVPSPAIRFAER